MGDKERRGTDQQSRDLKQKLFANIDAINDNLGEVKKHLARLEDTLIKKIDDKINMLIERQDIIFKTMEESRQTQNNSVEFFKTDAQDLIEKVNEVSAKIMDFEK